MCCLLYYLLANSLANPDDCAFDLTGSTLPDSGTLFASSVLDEQGSVTIGHT